jgi:hypothetical protein
MSGVDRLDDQDYPAITMGQAAQSLDVQPAFLRSLDAAGVLQPQRSEGGHRRYSRRHPGASPPAWNRPLGGLRTAPHPRRERATTLLPAGVGRRGCSQLMARYWHGGRVEHVFPQVRPS